MKKYYPFFRISLLTISITIFMNCVLQAQSSITAFKNESGRYGFKKDNEIIIPPRYDSAYNFEYGFGRVKLKNKWGYVDKNGTEVVPIKFFWIEPATFFDIIEDGGVLYPVEDPTGWYRTKLNANTDPVRLVNKNGKELLFDDYSADGFFEDLLEVKSGNKWGFADYEGQVVIPMKFQQVYTFQKGRAKVKLNDNWGLIDKTGKEIIPIKYDSIQLISSGKEKWYRFKLNDKFGLIDSSGNEVAHAKYDEINFFTEGLVPFKINGKWGYIDKTGKEVIPAQYDVAYTFSHGTAVVKKDGKSFLINSPLTPNQNKIADPGTKTETSSVPLVKPPVPLKGKIDPAMVGLWKYTDASGRITYMKMNADGTSESYLNAVTPANKSKGFCYWLIDGSFYESVCDGGSSVNRYSFEKSYDKATGKPTLNLAGYIYIAADNKSSW